MKEKMLQKLEKEKLLHESNSHMNRIADLEEDERMREQKEMGIGVSNMKDTNRKKKLKEIWPEAVANP